MARYNKNTGFIGYIEPPLSAEDIAEIKTSPDSIDGDFLEILAYVTETGCDLRLQYKSDDNRYHAVIYFSDPQHECVGIGVRAKARRPDEAIMALATRLRRIGKTDLRTLVSSRSDSGDIA